MSVLTILLLAFSLTACGNSANKKAAAAVDVKIKALGDVSTLTLGKEDEVIEGRRAYNLLTSEQKELVTKLEALVSAEKHMKVLKTEAYKAEAEDTDAKIIALGDIDNITLDKASVILDIRYTYNSLTFDQQDLVANLDKLVAAERKIADLKAEDDRVSAEKAAAEKAGAERAAAAEKATAEQAAAEKAAADRSANAARIDAENQGYSNQLKEYMYTGFGDPEYTETSWYDNIKDIIVKNNGSEKYAEIRVGKVLNNLQMNATMGAVLYNDVVPLKKVQLINSNTGAVIDEQSK